jgi:hypothetical protein
MGPLTSTELLDLNIDTISAVEVALRMELGSVDLAKFFNGRRDDWRGKEMYIVMGEGRRDASVVILPQSMAA